MITITGCFHWESFSKWDIEMWSHDKDDKINRTLFLFPSVHEKKNVFECPECHKVFTQVANKLSKTDHGSNEQKYTTCTFWSQNSNRLLKVKVDHKFMISQLIFCFFSQKSYLKNHVDAIHKKRNRFKCDLCSKFFTTKQMLEYHLVSPNVHRITNEILFELDHNGQEEEGSITNG